MLNKESFLFIAVMVFFIILFATQLIAIGYLISNTKNNKVERIN
jgi:hypothetical protein